MGKLKDTIWEWGKKNNCGDEAINELFEKVIEAIKEYIRYQDLTDYQLHLKNGHKKQTKT